jgi:hypothetical protein
MEIAWLLSMITVAVVHPVASSQPLLILDEGRVLATGVSAPSITRASALVGVASSWWNSNAGFL